MRQPFDAGNDGRALGLSAAIQFVNSFRPEPLDPFFLQPGWHRSRHVKHDLKTGKIVAVAHCLRQRPDAMHHGRHEIEPLHLVGFDQAQRFLGIEFDEAGHPPAGEQRQMRHDERRVVIERAGIEQRGVMRHPERRYGCRIGHRRLVSEDHLRPSRRAAAGHRLPVARDRVRQGFVRKTFRHEIGRHRIRRIPVGLAADHKRGLENLEHGGGLAARQPPSQRGRCRTTLPYRKGGFEKGVAVG